MLKSVPGNLQCHSLSGYESILEQACLSAEVLCKLEQPKLLQSLSPPKANSVNSLWIATFLFTYLVTLLNSMIDMRGK